MGTSWKVVTTGRKLRDFLNWHRLMRVKPYIWEFVPSWLRLWGVQLNLLSYTSDERIADGTSMCLHYSLYSWRRSEQVFPRDFFSPKRLFQFFFSIHTTHLFLGCKYQHLCLLKTYQFLVIHEWPSVFFLRICIIVTWFSFFDWSLKLQLWCFSSKFSNSFLFIFSYLVVNSS